MDNVKTKIEKHQAVLTQYIQNLAATRNAALGNTMNYQAVVDTSHHHYQLLKMGWHQQRFIFQVLIHLDIHPDTGNIWIQQNNTEIVIDKELREFDIPKKHFVLGFRPIEMRKVSDFAVA